MVDTQDITVLSLCTGYGGLELGLARALENPLRVVAVEIEAYALANLVAKAEEGKLAIESLWPDLRTFPAERFRGCFDFVLAGYPCQPFSCAGKRAGTDDPRHLWPHIARIIEAVRPVWFFGENVPGHLSLGFPEVYCSLRDMGYQVEVGLFTAAEVGAPHKRQRLFVLARGMENARNARNDEPSQDRRDIAEISRLSERERKSEHSTLISGRIGIERRADELAIPKHPEPGLRIRQEPQAGIRRDRLAVGGECMADASGAEHEGRQGQPSDDGEELQPLAGSRNLWPARPDSPGTNGKSRELWQTPAKHQFSKRRQKGQKERNKLLLPSQVGDGKLNPAWVEQLMGLETEWTAFDFSETESCLRQSSIINLAL